jgi:hypothetical protein
MSLILHRTASIVATESYRVLRAFVRASEVKSLTLCAGLFIQLVHVQDVSATSEDKFSNSAAKKVSLHVVTVKASAPREENEAVGSLRMSESLVPLRQKLSMLPFRSFEIMSDSRVIVSMKKRHQIDFADGHRLVVRPLYLREDGTICLWLRWKDKEGVNLLDSRIYVPRGESVLAGAEQTPTSGLILAIDVAPAESE